MASISIGTATLEPVGGEAHGLSGVTAKLHLCVAGVLVGVLITDGHGQVVIAPDDTSHTLLELDSYQTLVKLLGGVLNPIVAYLQGRLSVQGDAALALRVLLGLQAGSPWRDSAQGI
jgi:hypothetical protein